MARRACLCGRVDCTHHRRRTPSSGATYGADHQERRRRLSLQPRPWFCGQCGVEILDGEPWEAGHIDPVALAGGPEVRHEHRRCNRAHGARLKEELRKREADARAARRIAETYRYLEGVR